MTTFVTVVSKWTTPKQVEKTTKASFSKTKLISKEQNAGKKKADKTLRNNERQTNNKSEEQKQQPWRHVRSRENPGKDADNLTTERVKHNEAKVWSKTWRMGICSFFQHKTGINYSKTKDHGNNPPVNIFSLIMVILFVWVKATVTNIPTMLCLHNNKPRAKYSLEAVATAIWQYRNTCCCTTRPQSSCFITSWQFLVVRFFKCWNTYCLWQKYIHQQRTLRQSLPAVSFDHPSRPADPSNGERETEKELC